MAMEEYKKNIRIPPTAFWLAMFRYVLSDRSSAVYELKNWSCSLNLNAIILRSKTNPKLVRVKPQFRNKLQFKRINFMDSN